MEQSPIAARLRSIFRGELKVDEPLSKHTSFRIGGPADFLAIPADREELNSLLQFAVNAAVPFFILGRGTNILAPDQGFRGLVIKIADRLDKTRFEGQHLVVEGGASLSRAAWMAVERGLAGLEFAVGIPGTVGGGLVMNAGAFGGDLGRLAVEVTVMDLRGGIRVLPREELSFGYRTSSLAGGKAVVVEAVLRLQEADAAMLASRARENLERRRLTQPLGLPSAGSVFKNPPGDFAGRLIEAAGCKGLCRGDACVSELHANYIVNRGSATARDVLALMEEIQEKVGKAFGVYLEPEIQVLGVYGSGSGGRWKQS